MPRKGAALGTVGDIVLVDLAQYILAMRRRKTDVFMHFYFDAAAMAYRVVWRIDGACLWRPSTLATPGLRL